MRTLPALLSALALTGLAGCETTPRLGDRAPPVVEVFEGASTATRGRGLPVVFTTAPTREPTETTCPDGARPYAQPGETPGQRREANNLNYLLRPDQGRVALVFAFGDASGIRSATVSFDARSATLHAPDLPIVERPSHGGSGAVGRFRLWEFEATGTLRTGTSLVLEITPTGAVGTPIGVAATDGAGNRMSAVFFVTQPSALCR